MPVKPAALGFCRSTKHNTSTRLRLRRLRRILSALVLLTPALFFLATDLLWRGEILAKFEKTPRITYAMGALLSLLFWTFLLFAAARRRGNLRHLAAGCFVLAATFIYGGQTYFHQHWNTYLTREVSVFTKDFWGSVVLYHLSDLGAHLRTLLPILGAALVLVWAARRVVRARFTGVWLATAITTIALTLGAFVHTRGDLLQAAPPDVLWAEAFGAMIGTQCGLTDAAQKDRPRCRSPLPLPHLGSTSAEPRNVFLFLLESVRADAVCIEHDPACEWTPHTNALLPGRFPFTQMRALDSTTVISTVVLLSGLGPHEDRETLFTTPWLFDYARAAGYTTAYWTSQDVMFGNLFLWRSGFGLSSYVSGTQLKADLDSMVGPPENLLADHVIAEMGQLKEPFFAVVHLSNTHFPYYANPDLPHPFSQADIDKWPSHASAFRPRYQNAVWQQDQHIARIINALRSTDAGKRTAIVYTSDHGEAFNERGHGGHIFSMYDEEIHVPAWIDAPEGKLTEAQKENLSSKKHENVFHVDITPTVLDWMGIWDEVSLAPFKGRLLGTSLLRKERTTRPLLLTNCSALWSCASENWGAMHGDKKLFARAWDQNFRCYDVKADPEELNDLGAASCGDLLDQTLKQFGRMPGPQK